MKLLMLLTNRQVPLIAVLIIVYTSTHAQQLFDLRASDKENITVIDNWVGTLLKREIPNLDPIQFSIGQQGITLVNFLTDDLFVPVFGEAYDKMGQDKATKIMKELDEMLKNKKMRDNIRWVHFVFPVFSNYTYYSRELAVHRKLREKYEKLVAQLNDENRNILPSTYRDYRANYRRYYAGLLPGELKKLGDLLEKSQEGNVKEKAVKEIQASLDLPVAPLTIPKLLNFWNQHTGVVNALSMEERSAYDVQFREKLAYIVLTLMKEEQARIDALPSGDAGIETGNQFYTAFKKNYYFNFSGDPEFLSVHFPEVKKTLEKYKTARLELLQSLVPEVNKQIAQASAIADLNRIFEKYLEQHPENLTGFANDIDTRIRYRKSELRGTEGNSIEVMIKKQTDAYTKMLLSKGELNLQGVKDKSIFARAWQRKLNSFGVKSNESRLLFKMLLAVYSEKCKHVLPANSERIAITTTDYKGSSFLWGWPFNKIIHNYEKKEIAVFYIHPNYAEAFTNFPVLHGEDAIDIWQHLLVRQHDNMESITQQAVGLWLDADTLISTNGCQSPALQTVMSNLNYYFSDYSPPMALEIPKLTAENGYQYNAKERYYVKEMPYYRDIYYVDAPANFVPSLDSLLASKKTRQIHVLPEDSRSTGIRLIQLSGAVDFALTLDGEKMLRDKKTRKKIPLPPSIAAERKKNGYELMTIWYHRRSLGGDMERAVKRYWIDRGALPSQEMQEFFKDVVEKPVSKIELEYFEK